MLPAGSKSRAALAQSTYFAKLLAMMRRVGIIVECIRGITLAMADFESLMLTNMTASRCLLESFNSLYETRDIFGREMWFKVN